MECTRTLYHSEKILNACISFYASAHAVSGTAGVKTSCDSLAFVLCTASKRMLFHCYAVERLAIAIGRLKCD